MKRVLITGAGGSPATNFIRSLRLSGELFHVIGADADKFCLQRAETDERARDEAKPHIESLFNKFLNLSFEMMFPPGYLSLESAKRMAMHKKQVMGGQTVDSLINLGICMIGTVDTVRKKLVEAHRLLGFQNFLALLQFGTLPRALAEKNIRLFSTEVAPALQQLTDREYMGLAESVKFLGIGAQA